MWPLPRRQYRLELLDRRCLVTTTCNTAPSILLVIAGVGLALVPGLPRIEPAPELVLLGILSPLIYSAGVAMSWREFRFNLRQHSGSRVSAERGARTPSEIKVSAKAISRPTMRRSPIGPSRKQLLG